MTNHPNRNRTPLFAGGRYDAWLRNAIREARVDIARLAADGAAYDAALAACERILDAAAAQREKD